MGAPGKPFAALEPMAAPTNALVTGNVHLVVPGDAFTATFTLTVTCPTDRGCVT